MHMLLLEDNTIIDDKEGISEEVTRFYRKLFWTQGDSREVQEARRELLCHTVVRISQE